MNLQFSDGRYYKNTVSLDAITAPVLDLSLNSKKITNLALPTSLNDGVNKTYCDNTVK